MADNIAYSSPKQGAASQAAGLGPRMGLSRKHQPQRMGSLGAESPHQCTGALAVCTSADTSAIAVHVMLRSWPSNPDTTPACLVCHSSGALWCLLICTHKPCTGGREWRLLVNPMVPCGALRCPASRAVMIVGVCRVLVQLPDDEICCGVELTQEGKAVELTQEPREDPKSSV